MQGQKTNLSTSVFFESGIPQEIRTKALDSELSCYMCGVAPGETDSATGETAKLCVSFNPSGKRVGACDLCDLLVSCAICNEGMEQLYEERRMRALQLIEICRTDEQEGMMAKDHCRKLVGRSRR